MSVCQINDRFQTEEGEVRVVPSQGNCFSKDSKPCFFLRKKEGFSGMFCTIRETSIDAGPCYPNKERPCSICYQKAEPGI